MKILVLMSTFNGGKYLQEQLDSLYRQTVPIDILVRDDGSTDGTLKILEKNARLGKLQWYTGENLKPAKSFWDMVQTAPEADYYAFCDQDDVWNKDKVERAVGKMNDVDNLNQAILYCSNVMIVDKDLNPIRVMKQGTAYTDFAHSLIYSLAPGCTMVFNDIARREMKKYDMNREFEIIHDWLAHKIVSMLGTVVYDSEPTMLYRQHGDNVIGAQHSIIRRVLRLLSNNDCVRSKSAESILKTYEYQIDDETKQLLKMIGYYKGNKSLYRLAKKDSRFKTTPIRNLLFKFLLLRKKI